MVAYSFNNSFASQVASLTKRQTVRLPRKRHARPGESVQLYTGMRTKHCRKLVDPDPICIGVDEIEIRFTDRVLSSIEVNGIPVTSPESLEAFAIADGFGPSNPLFKLYCEGLDYPASTVFCRWWSMTHPGPVFNGVVIRWEPVDG